MQLPFVWMQHRPDVIVPEVVKKSNQFRTIQRKKNLKSTSEINLVLDKSIHFFERSEFKNWFLASNFFHSEIWGGRSYLLSYKINKKLWQSINWWHLSCKIWVGFFKHNHTVTPSYKEILSVHLRYPRFQVFWLANNSHLASNSQYYCSNFTIA